MSVFIPEEHIGRLIVRAKSLLESNLHQEIKAKNHKITVQQWSILIVLWEEEGISQKILAQKAFKDNPTTTRIISLLEKQGIIKRKRNNKDTRIQQVYLTQKGKQITKDIIDPAQKVLNKAQQGLTAEELVDLKRMLNLLNQNLSNTQI